MLEVVDADAGLAYGSGIALLWRSYGDGSWLGHTAGGSLVTGALDLSPAAGVGVIVLAGKARARSVTPGGALYERLHREAVALAR